MQFDARRRLGRYSKLTKAIIPAAGLGTRLLSVTKEQPKEMLPVFAPAAGGGLALKPLVQMIFEQLYESGFREFCFVVGRGKRAIEDHFTPDTSFVEMLRRQDKKELASDLSAFYHRVERSTIFWLNQPRPRGFGDAVLCAKAFADGKPVLVHAGDNHVISPGNAHLKRLLQTNETTKADATILLRRVNDPRNYGVAEVRQEGQKMRVVRVTEKPERPKSKWALLPTYAFGNVIFDALEAIKPGKAGEFQLTDAIQGLIDQGLEVIGVPVQRDEFWLDVGNPEAYWQALRMSHEEFKQDG